MLRSKVKVTGGKKMKKCCILFRSRPLGCSPHTAFYRERSSGARLCRWENQCMLSNFISIRVHSIRMVLSLSTWLQHFYGFVVLLNVAIL